ncbi:DUF3861 domain-containing protein [Vibrio ezurae]|uniref:DUF3861 domain-containing protein n=1 Tax=Vibrio ezurae NBRC 102218 TaxID=1219080 RepID=U3CCR2_9VIBR|nr:DUF3861 domain-containing protein [Vibrio ezurae]GAD79089.1 hypothetical protein VEZ01S_08_01250 [Vibrio ezurae NBRC 102218]
MIRKVRKDHHYSVTIEETTAEGEVQKLQFEFEDREDMFNVVAMVNKGTDLTAEEATRVGVALRLLGPVMMVNRKHTLFSEFMPHFKTFMQSFKKGLKAQQ